MSFFCAHCDPLGNKIPQHNSAHLSVNGFARSMSFIMPDPRNSIQSVDIACSHLNNDHFRPQTYN